MIQLKPLCFILSFMIIGSSIAQDSMPDAMVIDDQGATINLKDYVSTGTPKIVSLWATWCAPCRVELNALKKVASRWKEDYQVEIIAVSVDMPLMVKRARKMFETNGWDYTFFHDADQELMAKLGAEGIPYSMLIDGKGNIHSVQLGYFPNYEKQLEKKIKSL